MWIAHYKDGKTINQKKIDYKDVKHKEITSLQLLYNGIYYTISKTDETQQFFQERRGAKSVRITRKGKETKEETINRSLIGQRICCVYNSNGDFIGWNIDYLNGIVNIIKGNVIEIGLRIEAYNIELETINGDVEPKLSTYEMKTDGDNI